MCDFQRSEIPAELMMVPVVAAAQYKVLLYNTSTDWDFNLTKKSFVNKEGKRYYKSKITAPVIKQEEKDAHEEFITGVIAEVIKPFCVGLKDTYKFYARVIFKHYFSGFHCWVPTEKTKIKGGHRTLALLRKCIERTCPGGVLE
jgi:hypothetical protein